MEQKALQTINEQDQALTLPGEGSWVVGLDELAPEDFVLPYIRLTQPISDDVVEGKAKPGEFRHSITGDLLGGVDQPLEFIPVHVSTPRSRFQDRARVCWSPDGRIGTGDPGGKCAECPYAQWGADGKPPECTRAYQYVVLLPEHEPLPIALILAKTSARTAKRLNYYIKAYRKGSVFALKTHKETNDKGTFYVFDVERARDLTPEEIRGVLEIHNMLAGKNLVVEQDPSDFDFDGSASAAKPDTAPPDDDSPF